MNPLRAWFAASVVVLFTVAPMSAIAADDSPASTVPASNAHAAELNNHGVTIAKGGDFEQGIALVRQAMQAAPDDPTYRTNLSGMLTDWAGQLSQQGRSDDAIHALEEAAQLNPANGGALVALGTLSYTVRNDLSRAIDYWTRAHGHIPADQWQVLSDRLTRMQQDQQIERGFSGVTTEHFTIRYQSSQSNQGADALGASLEAAYRRVQAAVGRGPETVPVIVYTAPSFQRVAGRRDWAVGLYDGRIRLRVDDVGSPRQEAIITHELAHAFLSSTYGPRLPTWIHEGFAQVMEPSQALNDRQDAARRAVESRTAWVPLKWLDRRFEQPSRNEDVEYAYMEARVAVQRLVDRYGMPAFQTFVANVSHGTPIDRACEQAMPGAKWAKIDQGSFD